jgi:uncharacterized membrane protein
MRKIFQTCLITIAALTALAITPPALAQSQTLYWQRLDSDIVIQNNGEVRVKETWQVVFTSGSFHFGYRDFDVSKLESISDIAVSEGNRKFAESKSQQEYTFETYTQEGKYYIKWYFLPTSNSTHTYLIEYTVKGIVRIYPGGDQLYWIAVFLDHAYPVRSTTATVHLPANFEASQIQAAITTGSGKTQIPNGQIVVFTAQDIPPQQELEIRAQFPHGVVTSPPPSWQAAADQTTADQAQRQQYKSVFDVAFLFLSLILVVAGPLALYLLWYVKGRDAPASVVAQTSAPPDDFPPGVVGTLIDESADLKDIIATIVDLGRRGILKITEKDSPGLLGIGTDRDFTYALTGDTSGLRTYERTLIQKFFGGRRSRDLSDLKEEFYTIIPQLKNEMYGEATKLGFFAGDPQHTRRVYMGLGFAALVLFGLLGCGIASVFIDYSDLAYCPLLALVATAIGLIVLSPFMPRRTPKGATERAKWLAFKRYLESIEKFTKLDQAKYLFDKYLPYAISFGLEQSWVRKFAAVGAPAPTWYETYPPIGYGYPRDYRGSSGTPGSSGSGGGGRGSGSMPSLDQAAGGMFNSLNSMSTGFFSMLNSTSSVLTSAPSSSGSGGGGGWSGGGGGGGGGSGGGGGGFG